MGVNGKFAGGGYPDDLLLTVESAREKRDLRIAVLSALIIYGILQWVLAGYIIDDTFIHLTYARNIATGHGFSFTPDQPSNGVSAPLWTLLLAVLSFVFTPGPGLAKTLSVVCGALTITALSRLAQRVRFDGLTAGAVVLVWGANVWLARWSASGMESSLAVLLLIIAFDTQFAGRYRTAGFVIGLAVLTRPETAGLLAVFGIDRAMNGSKKEAVKTFLFGIAPILIWSIFALWHFGSLFPNPMLIKSDALLPPLGDVVLGLRRTIVILVSGNGLEITLAISAIVYVLTRSPKKTVDYRIAGLLLIWAVFPAFTYLSRGVFVQSRYLLIGIPPLIIGGFWALNQFPIFGNESHRRRVLYLIAAVLIAQQLMLTRLVTLPHVKAFQETISALVRIAGYIDNAAPPNTTVAVGDVGIVGFYCGRRVLDLEGLVSTEIIPFRLGRTLDEFILSGLFMKARRPDYIIDKSRDPRRLEGKWGAKIEKVFPVPGGLVETSSQSWNYTLYRLPEENK